MVEPVSISLATAAVVAATVSAFKDAMSLLKKWQVRRTAKKNHTTETDELSLALVTSPEAVQRQYNDLVRVAGRSPVGDDARSAVRSVLGSLSTFNRTVLAILRAALSQATPFSVRDLLLSTNALRTDVMLSLAQLFQTPSLSGRIPRNPPGIDTLARVVEVDDDEEELPLSPRGLSGARLPLLTYHEHAAPSIPVFRSIDTASGMRSSFGSMPSMASDPRCSSRNLRDNLEALSQARDGRRANAVDIGGLASARLMQTHLDALRTGTFGNALSGT